MKVSRTWLQNYFETSLPSTEALAEALTFHACEIDEIVGEVLDVKILPDRAAYALSHRGIAKEISAILNVPLKKDPLNAPLRSFPETKKLAIEADTRYVVRHTGAIIQDITVGPSPQWLKEALESLGQRSINNVVDALNYVLLDIGQPSGAFDLAVLGKKNDTYHIGIRPAKNGEKIKVLTGETHELSEGMYVFSDLVSGELLDIAGIKGGLSSGVTEKTNSIFLSVGNYDGTLVRRTSQKLKLFTDASIRYQNRPSPELTAYGMRDLVALITSLAGGTLLGVVDVYPNAPQKKSVSVTQEVIERILGAPYTHEDIATTFTRLGFEFSQKEGIYTVAVPFERNDLTIPEDLVEEIGRINGYERIPSRYLLQEVDEVDQSRFRGIEKIKDQLVEQGFIEVSTQSFAKNGEIKLTNPLDSAKPYLRTTLDENLSEAATHAKTVAPLFGLNEVKLFEVGSVFTKAEERMIVGTSVPVDDVSEISDDNTYTPRRYVLEQYHQFSPYPFLLRDIAVWTPEKTTEEDVSRLIKKAGGPYLIRCDLFDSFSKEGKISYAFHLVFQSSEKTLSDEEIKPLMEHVIEVLQAKNDFKVR